jgi:hypothetical protein
VSVIRAEEEAIQEASMEQVESPSASDFQRTRRRYTAEDRTLRYHSNDNLKSYVLFMSIRGLLNDSYRCNRPWRPIES